VRGNLRRAISFAHRARDFPDVLQVVLFGSVARGEDTPTSDVDVAVVYAKRNPGTEAELESIKDEKVQLTHLTLSRLTEEPTLAGALASEGLLLHGRPVNVTSDDVALAPKVLIAYDMSGLAQSDKMRIRRALYGGVSRSTRKGKEYVSRARGVAEEEGVEKVADSVLLVDTEKAPRIIGVLKQQGARWQEINVWTWPR